MVKGAASRRLPLFFYSLLTYLCLSIPREMGAEKENKDSALHVNKGVEPPPKINTDAVNRRRSKRAASLSAGEFIKGIRNGDRAVLGRAITLIESSRQDHQVIAQKIIEECLPLAGNSIRVGITGVPGVGKSTFIEALGTYLCEMGKKLAVLAI